jgi:hypothetical protein
VQPALLGVPVADTANPTDRKSGMVISVKIDLAHRDFENQLTVREIVLDVFFRVPADDTRSTTHGLCSQR